MFNEIWSIIKKNFKLVFRTRSLLFLLVIGPILLILLVGSAFSNTSPDAAVVGVVKLVDAPDLDLDLQIVEFTNTPRCLNFLFRAEVESCVIFEDEIDDQISVRIIYDGSRQTISQMVVSRVQSFLGYASDDISLRSTTELINSVNEFLSFARKTDKDLEVFSEELEEFRTGVNSAETSLNNAKNELEEQEEELIVMKAELDAVNDYQLQQDEDLAFDNALDAIDRADSDLRSAAASANNSDTKIIINEVRDELRNVEDELRNFHSSFKEGLEKVRLAKRTVNSALVRVQILQANIDNQLYNIAVTQSGLTESKNRMEDIRTELHDNLPEEDLGDNIAKTLAKPLNIRLETTLDDDATQIQILFSLIAATVTMFISILLANISTLNEIHSNAYVRTIISPVSRLWFILGLFITNFLLVMVQIGFLFNTAWLNFNINIMENIWWFVIAVALATAVFTLLGMIIAYLTNAKTTSTLIATFTVLVLFLISDALIPTEAMPSLARLIAEINPLFLLKEMFRVMMFFEYEYWDMANKIFSMAGYIVFGFATVLIADWAFIKRHLRQ